MRKHVTLPNDGASPSSEFSSAHSGEVNATTTLFTSSGQQTVSENDLASDSFRSSANSEKLGQKRARDARGIDKFKQIIYGENGFPRLHAMVERNPILMFPPSSACASRREWLRRQETIDSAIQEHLDSAMQKKIHSVHPLRSIAPMDSVDVLELMEQRKRLEATTASSSSPLDSFPNLEEVSNYHHKQLDSFLKLVYELNHAALLKMPMHDTLRMLSRCGREAVAHLTEFEMRARLKQAERLEERQKIRSTKIELVDQQLEIEDAEEALELEIAEEHLRKAIESYEEESTAFV